MKSALLFINFILLVLGRTVWGDSDDYFRSGFRNVGQFHLKQSFSGLTLTRMMMMMMMMMTMIIMMIIAFAVGRTHS